jgi:hypothetical protein
MVSCMVSKGTAEDSDGRNVLLNADLVMALHPRTCRACCNISNRNNQAFMILADPAAPVISLLHLSGITKVQQKRQEGIESSEVFKEASYRLVPYRISDFLIVVYYSMFCTLVHQTRTNKMQALPVVRYEYHYHGWLMTVNGKREHRPSPHIIMYCIFFLTWVIRRTHESLDNDRSGLDTGTCPGRYNRYWYNKCRTSKQDWNKIGMWSFKIQKRYGIVLLRRTAQKV